PDLDPVDATAIREAEDRIVRVRDEQLLDPVVVLLAGGLLAAAAPALRPVLRDRLALDVAGMREGDDHVGRRDEVLGADLGGIELDARAPLVAVLRADGDEFVRDDPGDA